MIIAVDGPAASGKGTLAGGLARHYQLPYLDTGLLYRAVGRAVEAWENSPDFEARAIAAAQTLVEADVEPEFLLSAKVGNLASKVAVIGAVRRSLFDYQREFATQDGGAVLDGRDIGTVICPEADVKLFIQADSKARMERRARQLEARGQSVDRYALYH
ncbi:MAG: (d)CMP kinase, partial [Devosia sp.]